jgi:glucuronokinase
MPAVQLNDPTEFGSLFDLTGISQKEGYLGGLRLLQATCKKFFEYCTCRGISLHRQNFTLNYETNVPRQVGLGGSSAIVSAVLKVTSLAIPAPGCTG